MSRVQGRSRGSPRGDRNGSRSGDRGQATVELALVIPFFVLLVVGLVAVARLGALQVWVVDAARSGARAAAVDPRAAVAEQAATAGADGARVAVTSRFGSGPSATVTVEVTRTVSVVPGLGWTEVDLEASSTMAVESVE